MFKKLIFYKFCIKYFAIITLKSRHISSIIKKIKQLLNALHFDNSYRIAKHLCNKKRSKSHKKVKSFCEACAL